MRRHLWIFRHGETDWNAQERFQGHTDIPLNDTGRAQAAALIPKLEAAGLQAILSSDLSRAQETARIISETIQIPIFTDSRLREAHLGHAQGLTRTEIEAQFGEDVARRWRSFHVTDADVSYPGGETGLEVMNRVFAGLADFMHEPGAGSEFHRIGISTHGGVIRRLMQKILPPGHGPVPIPNTVVYEIEYYLETKTYRVLTQLTDLDLVK